MIDKRMMPIDKDTAQASDTSSNRAPSPASKTGGETDACAPGNYFVGGDSYHDELTNMAGSLE